MNSILIVDDNPENLKTLAAILTEEGYDIRVATNGVQALEGIRLELPDLVLLDIQMPKMDGYEVCRQLKRNDIHRHIPVIFITAMMEKFNKVMAFQVGGNDYITKPFQIEEVVARVKTHLSVYNYQRKLEQTNADLLQQFKTTFEQAAVGIAHVDQTTLGFFKVNNHLCSILGYTQDELLNRTEREITHPDFIRNYELEIEKLNDNLQSSFAMEKQFLKADGSAVWCNVTVSLVKSNLSDKEDYFVIIVEDNTERKESEAKIKSSLADKETLLRELYHRTKNSLEIIRSMLLMQAYKTPDNKPVQNLVSGMENRIMAMALVHQKLYQSQDLSRINLKEYIEELAYLTLSGHADSTQQVTMDFDIEPVEVVLDTAVPCGLIINELIVNSLEHAFPDHNGGHIKIELHRNQTEKLELHYSDNGIGIPADFDYRKQESMGFQTILAIGENQMDGKVTIDGKEGFHLSLVFADTLYQARV
jgi:PAS domain S-box-containing protein